MSEGHLRLLIRVLVVVAFGFVAADFFYRKHGEFGFQHWPGFDAVFGFVAYLGLVLAGNRLRRLLARDEDYYDH